MKKHLQRLCAASLCAAALYVADFVVNKQVASTLFTVCSLFFSIGLGVIAGFDLTGVRNDKFYRMIKGNLNDIQRAFIGYYLLIGCAYLCWELWAGRLTGAICLAAQTLGMAYFILNFVELRKLKDDIAERLRGGD